MSEYAPSDPRERVRFVFHETPLRRFTLQLVRLVFKPLMQLRVDGLAHVPRDGSFILASNHVSNFDVFAMQLALPRTIFFMGKAELFRFAPVGVLLRDFGAFPVYRGEKDVWAFRHARKVLDAGVVLGMFPEGHRSRGKGLGVAKTGTARLAIESQVPVLPMAVVGTERLLKPLAGRPKVSVSFLEPVQVQYGETPETLTIRLMMALAAALPEHMRGAYASSQT